MPRAKHYLMVVGNAVHAVRTGSGTEETAALEAFGIRPRETAFSRITFRETTLKEMHSDITRTKAICELLADHKHRFGKQDDMGRLCTVEIDRIRTFWKSEWGVRREPREHVKGAGNMFSFLARLGFAGGVLYFMYWLASVLLAVIMGTVGIALLAFLFTL